MTNATTTYQTSKRERAMKPVLGAVAVFAAMATLSLTVLGPAAVSHGTPSAAVDVAAYRTDARPTEVAIEPAMIRVVAKRTTLARASSPYLPATYKN